LSFTVTELIKWNTAVLLVVLRRARLVFASPLSLRVTSALLGIISTVSLEATLLVALIGAILALGGSVTVGSLVDAVTVGTLPLVSLAATLLVVVEWIVLEAALGYFVLTHWLIGAVLALDGAITVLSHWDTITVGTGPVGAWASALGNVVEWILAEAT